MALVAKDYWYFGESKKFWMASVGKEVYTQWKEILIQKFIDLSLTEAVLYCDHHKWYLTGIGIFSNRKKQTKLISVLTLQWKRPCRCYGPTVSTFLKLIS